MRSQCKFPQCGKLLRAHQVSDKYCTEHRGYRVRRRYAVFCYSAKRRQIPVSLSLEAYILLAEDTTCYYCGSPMLSSGSGLDRLDNTLGYTVTNVVPCCSQCNLLRGQNLTPEETHLVVKLLEDIRGIKPIWKFIDIKGDVHYGIQTSCKRERIKT